jgi:hypothetical protein
VEFKANPQAGYCKDNFQWRKNRRKESKMVHLDCELKQISKARLWMWCVWGSLQIGLTKLGEDLPWMWETPVHRLRAQME